MKKKQTKVVASENEAVLRKKPECRAKDIEAPFNLEKQDPYIKFIDQLEDRVLKDIDDGKFSFELAKVGYDMYTDIVVYDYDLMLEILMANGYCPECADAFINAFAFWRSKPADVNNWMDFIVIKRKEKAETELMFQEYMQKYIKEEKRKAKKFEKKGNKENEKEN